MDIDFLLSQIEKILRKKKMSKGEFYERAGITASAVSQWRSGKTVPAKTTISRMAEVLEVGTEELIREAKKPSGKNAEGLEEEFIQLFKSLPREEQERELAYLRERAAGKDK